MDNPGKNGPLLLFIGCFLLWIPSAIAQYRVSGNLGVGLRYTRREEGESVTWIRERREDYNLGIRGHILDPRLALFNVAGALTPQDLDSNVQSGFEDSRLFSLSGNLSVLPTTRYPLDLRFARSNLNRSADSSTSSFGADWRIAHGNLPAMFVRLDRFSFDGEGPTPADTSLTTASVRLAKQLPNWDLDGEFGLQNFTDRIRGISRVRNFGRFDSTNELSSATTLRVIGNYFQEEESGSLGTTLSLVNRPDATLSRSITVGIRDVRANPQERLALGVADADRGPLVDPIEEQGQTILDANGIFSKAFRASEAVSVTPFTTGLLTRRFASEGLENSTFFNWASGVALATTHLTSDYGLGLAYFNEEGGGSGLGTVQQLHMGLQSGTLMRAYSVGADYTLTRERTSRDRDRHLATMRAEGRLSPTLFVRGFGEFFAEDGEFPTRVRDVLTREDALTFGANLAFTGIPQLSLDLGASRQRLDRQNSSFLVTRLTANLNYRLGRSLNLLLTGLREVDTFTDLARFEILTRMSYRLGEVTIDLEHRFETRERFGQPGRQDMLLIRIRRPFQFSF